MMTKTYVFPDLHGGLFHLGKACDAVIADGLTDNDTMVFLGDYIDRGSHSADVIAGLRSAQMLRDKTVMLSGNHEMMMLSALTEGGEQLGGWLINGGNATIESYRDKLGVIDEAAMKDDAQWFATLPVYHEDAHRVYVHAKVDPSLPLDEQQLRTVHWERYKSEDGTGYNGKHVVHGHEADQRGPITVGDRTCLDTGAIWTGRYVVGVFDDDTPGGPVKVLEVLA